jgi:DNA modification methylase
MQGDRKFKHNGETLNPFQKPLLLYLKHLSMFTQPGDLVIDITSGSGTTAVKSWIPYKKSA